MSLHIRKNGSNLTLDSNFESTTHLPGIKHSRVSSNASHAEFEKAVNEARTQTSKFLMTTVSPSVKLTTTQHQIKKALSSHIHDSGKPQPRKT
jgi:PhoPQ-activated pathogenicity-related protein